VSSFDPLILKEMEQLSIAQDYKVRTIYLQNFYPYNKLPPNFHLITLGDGVNISYEECFPEVVEALHEAGKIVCVWIDKTVTQESPEVFQRMVELRIDSYCSDYPLEVT
jgi:glycerophosphoryl diester phosphodiesterase